MHTHSFTEERGGTLVQDDVDFDVPGGRLLRWYVARDLRRIFACRYEALLRACALQPVATPPIALSTG